MLVGVIGILHYKQAKLCKDMQHSVFKNIFRQYKVKKQLSFLPYKFRVEFLISDHCTKTVPPSCNRSLLRNDNLGGPLDFMLPFEMVLNYNCINTKRNTVQPWRMEEQIPLLQTVGSTKWAKWQTSVCHLTYKKHDVCTSN